MMSQRVTVGVLGIPFGEGQLRPGVELAPEALRSAGLIQELERAGWRVDDQGNIDFSDLRSKTAQGKPESIRGISLVAATGERISGHVERVLNSGACVLNLGGDHGIALATITGAMRVYPDLRVIWMDAHGDSNTPETSPSGNFHGMPLAALMGWFSLRETPGFEWLGEVLRPDRLALVGVRDLDPGEKRLLESMGVLRYSADEVRQRGALSVIDECISRLDPLQKAPFHCSFDIDAFDPSVANATGLPVAEGLTLEEAVAMGRRLGLTRRMVSMDFVEINPHCGDSSSREKTLHVAIQTILAHLVPPAHGD